MGGRHWKSYQERVFLCHGSESERWLLRTILLCLARENGLTDLESITQAGKF
jgi:hypothetical protein